MRPLEERFWEKVVRLGPDDCWPWTGYRLGGYGKLAQARNGGRKVTLTATRVSWEMHVGPIPPGMRVLHRCDNPPCVNPNHLRLGTPKDNTQDMLSKWRGAHGEKHPRHRLTDVTVRELRRMKAEGATYDALVAHFGIDRATLHKAVHRVTWKHVA